MEEVYSHGRMDPSMTANGKMAKGLYRQFYHNVEGLQKSCLQNLALDIQIGSNLFYVVIKYQLSLKLFIHAKDIKIDSVNGIKTYF